MSKPSEKKWKLDADDVSSGMYMHTSGKSGQFERKLKTTGTTVFLVHEPTGMRIEGDVPLGNYSKKEMQKKRETLKKILFQKLELQVAKKLRVKGQ